MVRNILYDVIFTSVLGIIPYKKIVRVLLSVLFTGSLIFALISVQKFIIISIMYEYSGVLSCTLALTLAVAFPLYMHLTHRISSTISKVFVRGLMEANDFSELLTIYAKVFSGKISFINAIKNFKKMPEVLHDILSLTVKLWIVYDVIILSIPLLIILFLSSIEPIILQKIANINLYFWISLAIITFIVSTLLHAFGYLSEEIKEKHKPEEKGKLRQYFNYLLNITMETVKHYFYGNIAEKPTLSLVIFGFLNLILPPLPRTKSEISIDIYPYFNYKEFIKHVDKLVKEGILKPIGKTTQLLKECLKARRETECKIFHKATAEETIRMSLEDLLNTLTSKTHEKSFKFLSKKEIPLIIIGLRFAGKLTKDQKSAKSPRGILILIGDKECIEILKLYLTVKTPITFLTQ